MKIFNLFLSLILVLNVLMPLHTLAEENVDEVDDDIGGDLGSNDESDSPIELSLDEARELAVENSPEAREVRIKLDQLAVGVEMAENRHGQLKSTQEDLEEMEDELDEIIADISQVDDVPEDELEEIRREIMIEIILILYEDQLEEDLGVEPRDMVEDLYDWWDENDIEDSDDVSEDELIELLDFLIRHSDDEDVRESLEELKVDLEEGNRTVDDVLDESELEAIEDIIDELENYENLFELIEKYIELRTFSPEEQRRLVSSMRRLIYDLDPAEEMDDLILQAEQTKRELKQQEELSNMEWEQGQEMIKFQSEAMYIGLLMMEEVIDYMDEAVSVLEKTVDETRTRLEIGETVELELEAVKLELEQLEQEKSALENNYRELKREFFIIIGKPMDSEYVFTSEIEPQKQRYNIEELQDELLSDGKEIHIKAQELEFAKDNLEWAEENYAFYDNEVEMAELEKREAELMYDNTSLSMEKELLDAYDSYLESLMDYNLSDEALQVQEDFFEGVLIQDELGMVSDLDILEGELEVEEVELMNKLAEYQLYLEERQLELISEGYMSETYLDRVEFSDEGSLEDDGSTGLGADEDEREEQKGQQDQDMNDGSGQLQN